MLCGGTPDRPWKATATKLIELRNTLEEPLLVFVPSGLRTAAEDSLDIATFTELSLAGLSRDLVESLVAELDQGLQLHVRDVFEYLRLERISRHVDQEVEYLLTVVKNGKTPRAAGRALFVFGLIPDDRPLRAIQRTLLAFAESQRLSGAFRDWAVPSGSGSAACPFNPGRSRTTSSPSSA